MEIYVSVDGSDGGSGTRSNPFATLTRAIRATRQLPAGSARRIVALAGNYYDVGVELIPADSGLTICAAEGQDVLLWGGQPITGWEPDGRRFVAAPVAGVADGRRDFRTLIVNGRTCPRARFPHTGKLQHESVFDVHWMSTTKGGWERKPTAEELTTMRVRPGDLPADVVPRNLELTVYHAWDESLVGVESLDPSTGLVRFNTPAGHPPGAFGNWQEQARSFVAWNIREGMSEPGQWYLDRVRGCVVYWPRDDEDMATAHVVVPTQTSVVRITGRADEPVRDVVLAGFGMAATTTPLTAGGFGALAFDGAVSARHTADLVVCGLGISNVGGQGVKIAAGRAAEVVQCHIHSTGAGGVVVQGSNGNLVDNHIHAVGLTYASAIGLRCSGDGHLIAHNEIHDTPYSAISAGGTAVRVEHNLFHHVMQELVDGAAIYMFGARDCHVAHNVAHSIRDDQAHAYYLDEQSRNSTVAQNISLDVSWPLHMHMATGCTVRNNICTSKGDLQVSLMNCHRFTLEGNVLAAAGKLALRSSYTGIAALSRNVLHSVTGQVSLELHDRLPSLEKNQADVPALPICDNTVIADPRLKQTPGPILSFEPGSPALSRAIEPLDGTQAGVRDNPR